MEHASGTLQLANCYLNGIGTIVDKQKAFELYQNVANLGYASGIYSLWYCYQNGVGTVRDLDQAIYWNKKSAEQGNQSIRNLLKIKLFI